ncbi:hypothetical protein [uncultured Bacteroides sp.]|uniref:hypothetical protein n=1 Tax=uncultured Bacteroides sp. TaxID=162156 RepID=UPI0025CF95A4|nr:hypothetical protein [uncultured Bacteroides sp.]
MDEFDAVDIIYNAVSGANTGIMIYKDGSEAGDCGEHIVINNLQLNELDFINKVPININIFIPLNSNGMNERQRMKNIKRKVRKSLDSINSDDGNSKEITVLWSVPMPGLKENFSCTNIRLEILIDQ